MEDNISTTYCAPSDVLSIYSLPYLEQSCFMPSRKPIFPTHPAHVARKRDIVKLARMMVARELNVDIHPDYVPGEVLGRKGFPTVSFNGLVQRFGPHGTVKKAIERNRGELPQWLVRRKYFSPRLRSNHN